MNTLQEILDLFGLEFHNCKFKDKELPKLALVVNPNEKQMSVESVKAEFRYLPTVAFNVSILSGSEYAKINVLDANVFSDEEGWSLFDTIGFCGYNHKDKTVYIGYPYPYEKGADLPIGRAILHELGHYKQDVLYGANAETCNNFILEYHNIMFNENKTQTAFKKDSGLGIEKYRITYDKIVGTINVLGMQKIDVFSNNFHFKVVNEEELDLYYIVQIDKNSETKRVKINMLDLKELKTPQDSEMLREMGNLLIKQRYFKPNHILFINMLNSLSKKGLLSYTEL